MIDLTTYGYNAFFQEQFKQFDDERLKPARISADFSGEFEIITDEGILRARISGRLRLDDEKAQRPSAGDWVAVRVPAEGNSPAMIEHLLKRKACLRRTSAGLDSQVQVVAANVDLVVIVCGLDGDYNPRRIERMAVQTWSGGASPFIVLNKMDLHEDCREQLEETALACPGVEVMAVSALYGKGIEKLGEFLGREGQTAVLAGSSGAGKSTILNALLGEYRFETAEVRKHDSRGKHTTTRRQLVRLPSGGLILDTPGMREFGLTGEDGLDEAFSDIDALSGSCRFSDCMHEREPGCAVIRAVEKGDLSQSRLDAWLKLLREARSAELRGDERRRRQLDRRWGALHAEAKLIRRLKGDY